MIRLHGALDEYDSKKLLGEYGISVGENAICTDISEISELVERVPFPWAMKILSKDIMHKTDAGGVKLGITSPEEAEIAFNEIMSSAKAYKPDADIRGILIDTMGDGFELIMGVNRDSQFDHVILLGLGGIYVEMFKMVSMRLVPLSRYDAEQMIEELPLKKIFQGLRGKVYDKEEVIRTLLSLSKLCEDHPEITEVDINPFMAREQSGRCLDALIVAESE